MDQKKIAILGWMGTCLSIVMYVSYVFVIMGNLDGNKSGFVQPLAATFNCIVWFAYGFFKEKRDYPIMVANAPGIVFGFLAVLTSIF